MKKLMRAKFAGICSRTGARINKGDEIIFDTGTRTAYITNEDDTPTPPTINFFNLSSSLAHLGGPVVLYFFTMIDTSS